MTNRLIEQEITQIDHDILRLQRDYSAAKSQLLTSYYHWNSAKRIAHLSVSFIVGFWLGKQLAIKPALTSSTARQLAFGIIRRILGI